MDILGTGLSGLVGSKFVDIYGNDNSILNMDLTSGVDITDEKSVMSALEKSQATSVIHLAAFTDVNKAYEQTGDTHGVCYKVNVDGTYNIAKACKETGKHMIHVSTAFVFDGNKEGMYTEKDNTSPIEWYGKTKAIAEEVVGNTCDSYTILRIDQPFRQDTFPRLDTAHKMIEQLKNPNFKPFSNHYFAPTIIEDFATVLMYCIENKPKGIFHATSSRKISDFEYAQMIAKAVHLDVSVQQGDLNEYLKTTTRPYQKNTALDSTKMQKTFQGVQITPLESAIANIGTKTQ